MGFVMVMLTLVVAFEQEPRLATTMSAASLRTEAEDFQASMEGRTIVLKQNLYNLIDSDPRNPNIQYGGAPVDSRGVTIITPDMGVLYRYEYGSLKASDRDPERLVVKTGRATLRVLSYKAGESFSIRKKRGVIVDADRVTIVLVDELDANTPAGYSTTLTV